MKKRHQTRRDPSRWNRKNNLYRLHAHHHRYRSINGNWKDIPAVRRIGKYSNTISKIMTRLLRHQGDPREDEGAIEWRKLLLRFYPGYFDVKKWTKQTWLNHPEKGRNKNTSVLLGHLRSDSFHACRSRPLLEETNLIYPCRRMWKSRTIGLITFITLVIGAVRFTTRTAIRTLHGSGSHEIWIQDLSHQEVEQYDEKRRKQCDGILVSALMNHENEDASIAELQNNPPYAPFSEEPKLFIHAQWNVVGFELTRISRTIQCLHRVKYLKEWIEIGDF